MYMLIPCVRPPPSSTSTSSHPHKPPPLDYQQGQQFGGPLPAAPDASVQTLAQGAQQIVDIFVAKGFALKGDVIDVQGGGFTVRMEGPANLWGRWGMDCAVVW